MHEINYINPKPRINHIPQLQPKGFRSIPGKKRITKDDSQLNEKQNYRKASFLEIFRRPPFAVTAMSNNVGKPKKKDTKKGFKNDIPKKIVVEQQKPTVRGQYYPSR